MNPPTLPPAILVSRISSRSASDSDACHDLCWTAWPPLPVEPGHGPGCPPGGGRPCVWHDCHENLQGIGSEHDPRPVDHRCSTSSSRVGKRAGRPQLAWLVPVTILVRGEGYHHQPAATGLAQHPPSSRRDSGDSTRLTPGARQQQCPSSATQQQHRVARFAVFPWLCWSSLRPTSSFFCADAAGAERDHPLAEPDLEPAKRLVGLVTSTG
ncbi:hypothetical protein MMC34_007460 [Xylographa carneopallida]|nr:hypothetical protein [Xylographa carneopallida]